MKRHLFATAIVTLALTAVASAAQAVMPSQPPNAQPDQSQAPTTASELIERIRAAYRTGLPITEIITATAGLDRRGDEERIRIRINEDSTAAAILPPYIVNITDSAILVAHQLDLTTYTTAAESTTPTESDEDDADPNSSGNPTIHQLRSALPPTLTLPLWVALSDDRRLENPLAFVRGVRWNETVITTRRTHTITGSFPLGDVTLVADAATYRLRAFRVGYRDSDRSLSLTIRPSPDDDADPFTIDTTMRREVPRLGDLAPRPGDATPGRIMPPVPLHDPGPYLNLTERPTPIPPTPGILVITTIDAADTAARLLEAVRSSAPQSETLVVAVVPADPPNDLAERIRDAYRAVGDTPFAVALDEQRTLRRLSPIEPVAAAALGANNFIRATIAIGSDSDEETIARAAQRLVDRLPDADPTNEKPADADAPAGDP